MERERLQLGKNSSVPAKGLRLEKDKGPSDATIEAGLQHRSRGWGGGPEIQYWENLFLYKKSRGTF